MARQTRTGGATPRELPTPTAALMASNGETLETAMKNQQAVLDGMAGLGQEMMSFMTRRLQEDMETSRSMLACRTPEEAFQVQRRFAETATREYFAEAQKVMEMAARVARSGWGAPAADDAKKD